MSDVVGRRVEYVRFMGLERAPPGFVRWLADATLDWTQRSGVFATREGVAALLAAWQAGRAAEKDGGFWK